MHSFLYEMDGSSTDYLEKAADFESKLKFEPMTYQHSLNVATLSIQLANQSEYELDEVIIYYAGLFHDIGKSIMPLTVLKKEALLTKDEFSQMKEHAKQGFRILQKYKFPSDVLFAALLHHEKYDGSGYPIGFIGKEIPVIARIVAICDVLDALTSDRPYRKAYSLKASLQIMENSREQFDPVLIDVFLTGFAEKKINNSSV
ncbi:MAG: HD domain-containing protein [Eubacteriales bacterium]|nr:HD domain-containing protein [Eubacteriales bacterium]